MRLHLACIPLALLVACNDEPGEFTVSINPAAPTTVDALELSFPVESIDPQGDEVTYQITWKMDGAVQQDMANRLNVPSSSTAKGQVWQAEALGTDGKLESGVQTSNSVTVLNTVPTSKTTTVTPTEGLVSTAFACAGGGFADIDDDPEGYSYSWTVDGSEASTEATLAAGEAKKGQRIICLATPNDGEADGKPISSDPIRIGNTPPVLDSVSITPTEVTVESVMSSVLGASRDDDGDQITFKYSWTVNGDAVDIGEKLNLWRMKKKDVIVLIVTPFDGTDEGEPVSSDPITVLNIAPVIDSVDIAPSDVRTNGLVRLRYAARDGDGDTLTTTISWTINGKASIETTATLSGAEFSKGDKIVAKVAVNDGDVTVEKESAPITVQNTPPTAPNVLIDPPDPLDSDDLVCNIDRASTDADDDKITYTFAWQQDGTKWTGSTSKTTYTGDTIASADTSPGEDWKCVVTPNDGTDSGTNDSDTVTVEAEDTGFDSGFEFSK